VDHTVGAGLVLQAALRTELGARAQGKEDAKVSLGGVHAGGQSHATTGCSLPLAGTNGAAPTQRALPSCHLYPSICFWRGRLLCTSSQSRAAREAGHARQPRPTRTRENPPKLTTTVLGGLVGIRARRACRAGTAIAAVAVAVACGDAGGLLLRPFLPRATNAAVSVAGVRGGARWAGRARVVGIVINEPGAGCG
jgi:hypothetical protein